MTPTPTSSRLRAALAAFSAAALLAAVTTVATTANMRTGISRATATAEGEFGGCMILLKDEPSEEGLDCRSSWVTLDCDGKFHDKTDAKRMFDSAQLAFIARWDIRVWLDDERKHGAHCLVTRIDVYEPAEEQEQGATDVSLEVR